MRSSVLITAAFAATAFSTPMKRDLIIETDTATELDYVTDVVTITAGQAAPATAVAPAVTTTTSAGNVYHWGHHHHHSSVGSSSAAPAPASSSSTEAAPAPAPTTSTQAAPAPVPTTSTEAAPAPAPTTSTEAAPAPAPTTSSAAPAAPSSYSAPAPAPSSSSAAATTTQSAAGALASTYQQAVVDHHNIHRSNHSAPSITWDDNMASIAQEIANSCVYAHDMTKGTYGQNIAAGVPSGNISSVITDMFYNGEVNAFTGLYGIADPTADNFEKWGHFSQVVWKGTTKVGCATKLCDNLANVNQYVSPVFTVCNYSPPGNYAGEYANNIGDSLNQPSVNWSDNIANLKDGVTGDGY